MAFIRKRTTKTGAVSTALVESYRGEDGKPRHRIIANLHGAETLAAALGRLAAERDGLRKERAQIAPHIEWAKDWASHEDELIEMVLGVEGRKTAEGHLREAKRLLKRVAKIDSRLPEIQKEGVAIKKHCTATADEVRAEAAKHAKYLHDRKCVELGLQMMRHSQLDQLRRGKLRI